MLEKPSINDLTKITGESRYTTALIVAKRARQIADKRIRLESDDIRDCVELATYEFANGETKLVDEELEDTANDEVVEENDDIIE